MKPALPDDPAGVTRRWTMGWIMVGAAAVVVVSLFLPWIAADPDATADPVPKQLYGYEWSTALVAGGLAIVLGLYGWQGIARREVRFNVGALIALLFLLPLVFFGVPAADDSVVERLGAEPALSDSGDDQLANSAAVESRYGTTVAAIAGLVAIIPLVAFWSDQRRRRREWEVASGTATGTPAGPPPPPPGQPPPPPPGQPPPPAPTEPPPPPPPPPPPTS